MPTYPYQCECGAAKDVVHSIRKTPRIMCECGAVMVRGISSSVNFILNGPWSDYPSKCRRMNREMKHRNREAEKRMRKNRDPIKSGGYLCLEGSDFESVAKEQGFETVSKQDHKRMLEDQAKQAKSKKIGEP